MQSDTKQGVPGRDAVFLTPQFDLYTVVALHFRR
jgi:hypothetical protein